MSFISYIYSYISWIYSVKTDINEIKSDIKSELIELVHLKQKYKNHKKILHTELLKNTKVIH